MKTRSQKNVANKRRADIKLRMARMLNNKCTISCICVHCGNVWWREKKMTEKIREKGRGASSECGASVGGTEGWQKKRHLFLELYDPLEIVNRVYYILCVLHVPYAEVSHVVAYNIAHGALLGVVCTHNPLQSGEGGTETIALLFFSSLGANAVVITVQICTNMKAEKINVAYKEQ